MSNYEESDDFRLDGFFDMEEEEFEDLTETNDIIGFAQIDLLATKLNHKLLNRVICYLEKSFLWKFKSNNAQLKMIEETYKHFIKITQEKEE